MIQQRANDFLEVYLDGKYFYIIVLSKIVFFGGNLVFGFHGDGTKKNLEELLSQEMPKGFNCCVDLLYAKKNGSVERLKSLKKTEKYLLTDFAKSPITFSDTSERIWGWYIYSIHDLHKVKKIRIYLTSKYKRAMHKSCFGFLAYVEYVKHQYETGVNQVLGKNEN